MRRQEDFGMCCNWVSGVDFLKSQLNDTKEALDSVGFTGHRCGVITEAAVDAMGKAVVLCVDEIVQDGDVYSARLTDVRLECASAQEALATLGGLKRGFFVAFNDKGELIGAVTASFDD